MSDALLDSGRLARQAGTWDVSESTVQSLRAARCLLEGDPPRLLPDAPLSEAELGLPASVQGVVLARLDRLPEAARMTLKVASVFGRSFELQLLAAVGAFGLPQSGETVRDAIVQALERDFVRHDSRHEIQGGRADVGPRERYQFKHNITREVAYATLLEEQQQELHLAVGTLLEQVRPESVEELAHHFAQSDMRITPNRARALTYLEAAAERAARDYANDTALAWLDQALALEARPSLLRTRVAVLHVLARRDAQRDTLAELAKLDEPRESAAQQPVALLWGDYHESVGDYAAATEALLRARSEALRQASGPATIAAVDVRLGMVGWRKGDYDEAETHFRNALDTLEGLDASNAEVASAETALPNGNVGLQELADAHYGLGLVARQLSRFDEAGAHYQRDLALNRQLGNRVREARALFALGTLESMQRAFQAALPWYEQALSMRRTIGDRAGVGAGLLALAQTC
ncbi:MAG: tetratricopeptide repeat protein, partial [Caldilineaceae bacterium]